VQTHNGLAVPFNDRTVRDIRRLADDADMPRYVACRLAIEATRGDARIMDSLRDDQIVIANRPEEAA